MHDEELDVTELVEPPPDPVAELELELALVLDPNVGVQCAWGSGSSPQAIVATAAVMLTTTSAPGTTRAFLSLQDMHPLYTSGIARGV